MSEKILIIDDEQDIADLLEVYLKNENYVVYKFYCATDAMSWRIENSVGVRETGSPSNKHSWV